MSAITQTNLARHSALETPPFPALSIRWTISPTALLASPGAAILNGQAAKLRAAALVIHINESTARAELDLELTTNERSSISLASAPIERTTGGAIESLDVPGLLALTVRQSSSPEILYARTPLLERTLALPGGVYDPPTL